MITLRINGRDRVAMLATVTCCRAWLVVRGYSLRPCGLCGQRPAA